MPIGGPGGFLPHRSWAEVGDPLHGRQRDQYGTEAPGQSLVGALMRSQRPTEKALMTTHANLRMVSGPLAEYALAFAEERRRRRECLGSDDRRRRPFFCRSSRWSNLEHCTRSCLLTCSRSAIMPRVWQAGPTWDDGRRDCRRRAHLAHRPLQVASLGKPRIPDPRVVYLSRALILITVRLGGLGVTSKELLSIPRGTSDLRVLRPGALYSRWRS